MSGLESRDPSPLAEQFNPCPTTVVFLLQFCRTCKLCMCVFPTLFFKNIVSLKPQHSPWHRPIKYFSFNTFWMKVNSINQSNHVIVRLKVDQRAGQLRMQRELKYTADEQRSPVNSLEPWDQSDKQKQTKVEDKIEINENLMIVLLAYFYVYYLILCLWKCICI